MNWCISVTHISNHALQLFRLTRRQFWCFRGEALVWSDKNCWNNVGLNIENNERLRVYRDVGNDTLKWSFEGRCCEKDKNGKHFSLKSKDIRYQNIHVYCLGRGLRIFDTHVCNLLRQNMLNPLQILLTKPLIYMNHFLILSAHHEVMY